MSLKKRNLRTYVACVNVLMKSSNITQFLCFLFKLEKRIRNTISLDFKYALTKTLKDDILITNCVLFIFLSVASNDAYLFWVIVRKNEEVQNVKFWLISMQHLNYVKQSMIHFMLCFTMQEKISFERSVDYKHSKDLLTSRNLERMLCIATWCEKVLLVNIISSSWLN